MTTTIFRQIEEIIPAQTTSDGDGVKLKRVFGGQNLTRFDPFLMLDEFGSDEAVDYIGGFPPHPHRGFETITYMLDGNMEHRDHMDNIGRLGAGDVQWMNAGSGVIHSEMPQQEEGLMRGFQLWLNLPAVEKMKPASYEDIKAETIPVYDLGAVKVKSVAGTLTGNGASLRGKVTGLSTDPGYLDIAFADQQSLDIEIPDDYTSLLYVYEGSVSIGDSDYQVKTGQLARTNRQGLLRITAQTTGSRALVMTGKPIEEPIVHQGPFVMNTQAEIRQAIADYTQGTLVEQA